MIDIGRSEAIAFFVIVGSFIGILGSLVGIYVWRRTRVSRSNHKSAIEIEMMRRSIEGQIYGLSEKLVATESRWRDANHLLLSSLELGSTQGGGESLFPSQFLQAAGLSESDVKEQLGLILVLTPFHPNYQLHFDVVADVCRKLGLRVTRGDADRTDDVLAYILKLIVQSEIIVANVDGRNPNVFYELGIAHALGKTTILIASKPEAVEFEVRSKNFILFNTLDELALKTQNELVKTLSKKRLIALKSSFPA